MGELITTVSGTRPGVSFNVVLQRKPARPDEWFEKLGPLVEFYDARYPHTEHGQFVSRYYWHTLQNGCGGLCLDGGVPDWNVPAESMRLVIAAVKEALK